MGEVITTQVLIPAAGFGKRVGSPLSKEMLPDPQRPGQPLMNWGLERALEAPGATCHIITRSLKTNLLDHLGRYAHVTTQCIDETRDWPETLLKSEPYWKDFNLVLLPDTRFGPLNVLSLLKDELQRGADVSFATFKASSLRSWGVIDTGIHDDLVHCEKPLEWPATAYPWGLFGFRREAGARLLNSLLTSTLNHQWQRLSKLRYSATALDHFEDLTRVL